MDGILLIDKPQGWTSHDVVAKVRNLLKVKKIGHTGTLDPMATGLLVLCVGRATKFVKYLTEHDKVYSAEIGLGIQTDSDDITGRVINKQSVEPIDSLKIVSVLNTFIGKSMQVPPVASAIKVDGKRAYQFIHKNQELPEMTARPIELYRLDLIEDPYFIDETLRLKVEVACSKGTYIRSLARDIGDKMDIPATLTALRRTRVGDFAISEAVTIDDIIEGHFSLIDPVFHLGFEVISIEDEWVKPIINGAKLPVTLFKSHNETIVCNKQNEPLAIYRFDSEKNMMRLSVLLT